jgi:integrase
MPHLYLDRRKNPPIWRYQIWESNGRRKSCTGTTSKRETMDAAIRRQMFEHEIRDGVREAPKQTFKRKSFEETIDEYFAWGESQGGRGGRPWAHHHARCRRSRLGWWKAKLNVKVLGELHGLLPRAEKRLRELQLAGRSGKTLAHYAESLVAFCKWCVSRQYLPSDPLVGLSRFDLTPRTTRRLMSADEMERLLISVSPDRRLVYESALSSGLRVGELESLKVKHLDKENSGFILDAAWTKNRKPGHQPLPVWLVTKLAASAEGKDPDELLLKVPGNASQSFEADLKRAGIPKWAPGGKLDFHAMRVAYITYVIESGADIKTAQTLARHSNPQLTLGIYARTRPERLRSVAELVGIMVKGSSHTHADEVSNKTERAS